jgi:type IV pilus assembly protein PilP
MRWLAVILTSTYILINSPWGILHAADMAPPNELEPNELEVTQETPPMGGDPAFQYNPEDRRDPFVALVKEKPAISDLTSVIDPNRPRGSLERFDLSTLKLVGIVWGELGYRGMIRAPDNKGYFVAVGTYMGVNGGQVVDVAPDRLVIEEKYKDTEGNIVGKTLDLPLRREEKEEQER